MYREPDLEPIIDSIRAVLAGITGEKLCRVPKRKSQSNTRLQEAFLALRPEEQSAAEEWVQRCVDDDQLSRRFLIDLLRAMGVFASFYSLFFGAQDLEQKIFLDWLRTRSKSA